MTDKVEINYEEAMTRLGGNEELFQQYITFFEEDVPPLLSELTEMLAENNPDTAARAAHSIKGLVSNFGAASVVTVAHRIEASCKVGELDQARHQLPKLKRQLAVMSEKLGEYRKK